MQVLKEEIRERIIKVAEDLFYKEGFEGTTTRNIAANVGISVSNLYLYYENKEDIFSAVIEAFYQYLNSRFEELLVHNNKEDNISDKIYKLVWDFIVKDQRKFIILADKSRGTKYEYSKTVVTQELKKHICSLLPDTFNDKELMSFILSHNLIDGIVEIAKNYRDERRLADSLKHLIVYHAEGLKALLN